MTNSIGVIVFAAFKASFNVASSVSVGLSLEGGSETSLVHMVFTGMGQRDEHPGSEGEEAGLAGGEVRPDDGPGQPQEGSLTFVWMSRWPGLFPSASSVTH